MDYSLVASDWDFTLLRSDRTLSQRTIATVRGAVEAGLAVAVVSGRPLHGLRVSAARCGLSLDGIFLVGMNGAEVLDPAGHLTLTATFPMSFAYELRDLLRGSTLGVYLPHQGRLYATHPRSDFAALDGHENGHEVVPLADAPRDLLVGKVMVAGDPTVVQQLLPRLRAELGGRADLMLSEPFLLEVLVPGVHKGSGLALLCDTLGVPLSRAVACGDNENDIPMLAAAGLGAAVANALPATKAAADRVIASCDDDGVAHLIEEILRR